MPKQRHRKRVRTARLDANPIGYKNDASSATGGSTTVVSGSSNAASSSTTTTTTTPKVGKKEAETNKLIDGLRSDNDDERIWATSALSNIFLTLPPGTQRLLLSKNLIGILIEKLLDPNDQVSVESLGTLRNLAVGSITSLVSEMHNKKLLSPLIEHHLPILIELLKEKLGLVEARIPRQAQLPSSADDRRKVDEENERHQIRLRLFWDWSENVLILLWCLAETNTKVLNGLNQHAELLIRFALSFIDSRAVGIEGVDQNEDGMDIEGSSKKGVKKGKKTDGKKERVPLFVAVAAAQFLNAFISSNPPAHFHIWSSSSARSSLLSTLSTPTPPSGKTSRTDSHAASDPTSDAEEWLQLRVLSFGILLQLSSVGMGKKVERASIREALKESQGLLLELTGTDLISVAEASRAALAEESSKEAQENAGSIKLASYERQLSTLQLSLEILGEWCASLDAEALGSEAPGEEEEEWGGIAVDGEGDIDMDDDENEEVIIRKEAEMDAGIIEESEDRPTFELGASALTLFANLQTRLVKLAQPETSLSFARSATATTEAPTLLPTSTSLNGASSTTDVAPLLSSTHVVPTELVPIADIISTIHVRSIEALNNLYITLARAASSSNVTPFLSARKNELQQVWESFLSLVLRASIPSGLSAGTEEFETIEEKQREIVASGTGVAWGISRIALEIGNNSLVVGPSTTPFLIQLFSHPFAVLPTPDAESIRVRIAGTLGCLGRREDVSNEENEMIGSFLLNVLPVNKTTPSGYNPTPEVLIQVIDSLIDLYADEESHYDVAVFRSKGFLPRLEASVGGVRAQIKKVDRKKFPELRTRADGALENLDAFAKYRKNFA